MIKFLAGFSCFSIVVLLGLSMAGVLVLPGTKSHIIEWLFVICLCASAPLTVCAEVLLMRNVED